jgi:hypothetical protein
MKGFHRNRVVPVAGVVLAALILSGCPKPPSVRNHSLSASPQTADVDQQVTLRASVSEGGDADGYESQWDLDGDGVFETPTQRQGFDAFDCAPNADGTVECVARNSRRTVSYDFPQTVVVSHLADAFQKNYALGFFGGSWELSGPTSVASTTVTVLDLIDPVEEVPSGEDPATAVNNRPLASFSATPNPVRPERNVALDASASSDTDGAIVRFEWDLDGNGTYELDTGTSPFATTAYASLGDKVVGLRVTDDTGATGTTTRIVRVQHNAQVTAGRIEARLIDDGRGFRFNPVGRVLDRGLAILNGDELERFGVTAEGTVSARRFPRELRHGKRRVRWAMRADMSEDLLTGARTLDGFLMFAFPAGGRACVALEADGSGSQPMAGAFRVLGGGGEATGLRGRGTVRPQPNSTRVSLGGRLQLRLGAERQLDFADSGCAKLRRIAKPFR